MSIFSNNPDEFNEKEKRAQEVAEEINKNPKRVPDVTQEELQNHIIRESIKNSYSDEPDFE